MKKTLSILIVWAGIHFFAASQDCATYFPTTVGTELEVQYFNAKDKLQTISTYKVTDVDQTADGMKIQTHLRVEPQGKGDPFEDDFVFYCKGNTFYFEMEQFLKDMQMDQFENMDVSVESEDLGFPAKMVPGDVLDDANIKITIESGGMRIMSMTMNIIDRKVEGRESITTPAGTFDCYKITHTVESKTIGTVKMSAVTWYSEGVGAVRTEDYNSKGNLQGYSILTRLDK
jgi:hypothetical protein